MLRYVDTSDNQSAVKLTDERSFLWANESVATPQQQQRQELRGQQQMKRSEQLPQPPAKRHKPNFNSSVFGSSGLFSFHVWTALNINSNLCTLLLYIFSSFLIYYRTKAGPVRVEGTRHNWVRPSTPAKQRTVVPHRSTDLDPQQRFEHKRDDRTKIRTTWNCCNHCTNC